MFNYRDISQIKDLEAAKEFVGKNEEMPLELQGDFSRRVLLLQEEVEKYNSQYAFLQNKDEGRRLRREVQQLINFQKEYDDPLQIERANQNWLKNTLEVLEQEGGPYVADLKNQAVEGYLLASATGVRLAQSKIKKMAFVKLDTYDNQFKQALANNDLESAMSIQHEREAAINSFAVEGIFSDKEAKAFLKHTGQVYADATLTKGLEQNQLTEASEGKLSALQGMKDLKSVSSGFFNRASNKTKTVFLNRLNMLKKATSENNVVYAQEDYSNVLFNWMNGGATAKQVLDYSKAYKNSIKTALSKNLLEPSQIPKARREIERTEITEKLVDDINLAGKDLSENKKLNSPILDQTKSFEEILKHYDADPASPTGQLIAEIRSKLPTVKGDPVLTNVLRYEFARGSAGLNDDIDEPDTLNKLHVRIAQEKKIDALMGGEGQMSSYSAEAFRGYQQQQNPGAQALLNQMVVENPELISDVAKARAKPEFNALSTTVREFTNNYQPILNFTQADANALYASIQNNPAAETVYNQIFNFIEAAYEDDSNFISFAEQENIGQQQLVHAVTNSVYRDITEQYAATGDATKLLGSRLKGIHHAVLGRGGRRGGNDEQARVDELAEDYITKLTESQVNRGLVNITGAKKLQVHSDEAELVLGFGNNTQNFFGRLFSGSKKLERVEYTKVINHIEGLLPTKLDLGDDRLRLMTHSNGVYKLGYITGAGGIRALRDKHNELIFLNTNLIGKVKDIKKSEQANYLISLIKLSNASE